MGDVYLAEDERLGRKVALKILPEGVAADTDRLMRFEQEARAASALNHPNIMTVHEFGAVGTTHFLASEYVRGETIREKLWHGRLATRDALDVTIQIACALQVAHEAGILHRDVKPENVMVRDDGYVKVLDFGLAKLMPTAGDAAQTGPRVETMSGMIVGTAAYMSPEQALGDPVDARTDVFSLGVVLYEALSGQQPFKGETPSHTLVAIVSKRQPSLSALVPDHAVAGNRSEALDVCAEMEALSKQRYVSAYGIAVIYAGLAGREKAFEWFERAYEERNAELVWLDVDPRLGPLRDDPRLEDLVSRLGFARERRA
jgi:serine/threonine protein kinase